MTGAGAGFDGTIGRPEFLATPLPQAIIMRGPL